MPSNLLQDLRYSLRMLSKHRVFASVTILSLGLGLGINTTAFTLFYSLVWRPLPVKEPANVVNVYQQYGEDDYGRRVNGNWTMLSYPEYLNYRDSTHSLEGIAAYCEENLTVSGLESEKVNGQFVTDNYFTVLSGNAIVGRTFMPNECRIKDNCPEVILSYGFWQRHFGGDPAAIGQRLVVNNRPLSVIGVTAREWTGTEVTQPDVWLPVSLANTLKTSGRESYDTDVDYLSLRDFSWLTVIGRLKTDASLKQAQAELDNIARLSDDNATVTAHSERHTKVTVAPATLLNLPEARDQIIPVGIAATLILTLVLAVVCVNISNMLLARAIARQKEIGVRLALGASRRRIIQQLIIESLLLAIIGAICGLVLASFFSSVSLSILPIEHVYINTTINWVVFAYCLLAATLATLLFGVAPAIQATRVDVVLIINAQVARVPTSRLRSSLVVAQVALSMVLLTCAGLLLRGMQRAQSTQLNWQPEGVYAVSFDLASAGYDNTREAVFFDQLTAQLKGRPDIESVGITRSVPFASSNQTIVRLDEKQEIEARYNAVTADYFKTLRIPIMQGRQFTNEEAKAKLPYAVISQAMARRLWPAINPIGQHFNSIYEVIGVTSDLSSTTVGKLDGPTFYLPAFAGEQVGHSLLVRTTQGRPEFTQNLKHLVRSLDGNVAVHVNSLEEYLQRKLQPSRFAAILSSSLSLLATAMAGLGLYGLVAFLVSQRIREIGIRMALGAQTSNILSLVLKQGMKLVVIGTGLGLATSLIVSRLLAGLIFGVSNTDALTFTTVPVILGVTAFAACFLPARRAARVNPVEALRYE